MDTSSMPTCMFRVPDKTGWHYAPVGDQCVPCKWIQCRVYNADNQPINWCDVNYIGRGGYGTTYLYNDKIVKIIHSRKNNKTVYSERWLWKHMKNFPKNNRDATEEENRTAFVEDVMWEANIQHEVYDKIKNMDNNPITPCIYSAGVFVDPDGFYVGIIVMEKINGIGLATLLEGPNNITQPYIQSIIVQLQHFSNQMIALGFIHNDTAGDNIMIVNHDTENPRIRIIDWGFSVPLNLERYTLNENKWTTLPNHITKRTIAELESKRNRLPFSGGKKKSQKTRRKLKHRR